MISSLKNCYWDMIFMYKKFLSTKKLPVGFPNEKVFFANMTKAAKDYYSFCHPLFHQKVFLLLIIHLPFAFKLYQKLTTLRNQA